MLPTSLTRSPTRRAAPLITGLLVLASANTSLAWNFSQSIERNLEQAVMRGAARVLESADPAASHDKGTKGGPVGRADPSQLTSSPISQCAGFFPGNTIPALPGATTRGLCFSSFAVVYSPTTKTPLLVAQRLDRAGLSAARTLPRPPSAPCGEPFFADARLPRAERATTADFCRSGHDRGHLAPSADFGTREAQLQSYSLANIVPQDPVMNQNAWATIERDTRRYVLRAAGPVHILTGVLFEHQPSRTIGDGRVHVPSHLYKLVYDPATRRAWVHLMENNARAQPSQPLSYSQFVQRTGLQLLAGLHLAS